MKTAQITKPVVATVTAPAAAPAKKATAKKPAAKKADAMSAIVNSAPVVAKIEAQAKAEVTAKKERTVRPAQKPVAKKESAVVVVAAAKPVKFALIVNKPGAGSLMASYTQAVFELFGMVAGKAAPAEELAKVWGGTAIKYHTAGGRIVTTKDGVKLTSAGKDHFATRSIKSNPKDVEAYKAMLSTGVPDGRLVKRADHLKAI